jgi:hypothetical protein
MLADFAESAQQPTGHFKIQTVTQPTQFSNFQLNEANSYNQSRVVPSDFPTVFPNEPTPLTAAGPTASAGRIVKASSLGPWSSTLKQSTSDARSYIPGSAPNWSRHQGRRCSLQTHATNSTVVSPFARNSSRTVKLWWRQGKRCETANCAIKRVRRFLRARRSTWMAEREWGRSWCRMFIVCRSQLWRYQNVSSEYILCELSEWALCVAVARNDTHLFIVAAKCYEKLNVAILMNTTSCLWPP